jgi:hypothetical protein
MHMTLEGRNSLNVLGVTALKEIEKNLYGNLVVTGIYIRKCYDTIDRHRLVLIPLEEIRFIEWILKLFQGKGHRSQVYLFFC